MNIREHQVKTVKLEVEGDEQYLRRLKRRLELDEACESVEWVDQVTQDQLDTIELALDRVQEGNQLTLGELVERSGIPRDQAELAVEELGRNEEIYLPGE